MLTLAVALLHTSPARAYAWDVIVVHARRSLDLEVRATSFRYNLARLSVAATDLEIASTRSPAIPFFQARRVESRLSWRALTGAIDLDSLVVEHPRIDLRPVTDGTLNVPVSSGNTGRGAVPVFSLRELRVTGLDINAGMPAQELAFTARGVEMVFLGPRPRWLEGTVSFRQGAVFEFGTSRIPVDRADARVTFDGETIALPSATAIAGGGPLRASGRVKVLGPSPSLDLTFDWRPDAARVSAWNDTWPELAGQVHVRGRAAGSLRDPQLALQLDSREFGSSLARNGSLTGKATVTTGGLEIEAFEARLARGLVRGAGVLAFDPHVQSRAALEWSDVDPAAFASVLPAALARVRDVRSAGLADLRWYGVSPSPATVHGTLCVALTPSGPRHLGRATVTATGGNASWRLEARQQLPGNTVLDGTARVRLDAARWQRSPLAGRVTVRSTHPLALLDHARAIGLPVAALGGVDAAGPLSLQAAVTGSLGDPRAAGDLSLDGVDIQGGTRWDANATFTADSRAIGFAPLKLTGPASTIEARGALGLSGQGSGDLLMTIGDVSELLESVPVAWRPRGAVRATGHWSGTVRRPRVALDIAGSDFSVGGTRADALTGHVVYDDHVINLERLDLQQSEGGRLHASGRVDMSNGLGAISAEGRALRIGPTALTSGEPHHDAVSADGVSVSLELEGSHRNPRGAASITATTLRWGDRQIDRFDLSLEAHDIEPPRPTPSAAGAGDVRAPRLSVADITARVPAFNATITGTVALASPYAFSARTRVDDLDVEKVLRFWQPGAMMPAQTAGRIRLLAEHTGQLAGDPLASARVELGAFDGRLLGVPVVLARPAGIDFEGGDVIVRDAALDVGGLALRAGGATGPEAASPLAVDLDGPVDALRPWLKDAEPGHAWDAGGHVTGRLEMARGNGGLRIAGVVETTDLHASRDGVMVASGVAARATVHDNALHVDRLSGVVFGSSLDGTASIPVSWLARGLSPTWRPAQGTTDEPAKLHAHARLELPRVLSVLMRREFPNLSGGVDATLEAIASHPTLDAVTAQLVAERVEMGAFDDRLSQVVPTRASFANGRLVVEALDWKGPRSRVTAEGAIGLGAGSSTDLRVGADLGFRLLDLMLPGRAVGRGRVDLHVGGGPGNHRVTGGLTLTEAGLLLPGSRFALAGWNGRVDLSTEGLYARSLRGQLNGGDVSIEGRLPLGQQGSPGEGLTLSANGVFLEVPEGLRSQADARLEWRREGERSVIQGRVTLMSSSYREPVTRMLQLVDALRPSTARGSSAFSLPASISATALDVSLESSDPVVFENSLGRVEMIPRMRVVGSLAAPALAGSVEALDDGRLQIAGKTYRLTESSLRFSPADGLAPTLNLTGETRIGEYDVVLRVTGTPGRVETNFSSTPPLGERDLRSLVVTGRTENADLQGASGDQFALGAASSDVLGFAGKFVGLDSVRLGAADLELVSTDVRPSQHLTVSKSLGRQFEVIASENLDDNKLTWVFVWRPARNYQFRVASRENTDQSIEFRQELQFGPGARASAAPRSSRSARARRVTRVVLGGQPGFGQAELLDVLDLSAGDVFDFRKWLADRDRLEEFYRERGYFAARIVPSRREVNDPGGAPGVELEYVVQRNRRTTLEVVGDELPARAVEQMKVAWGDAPVVEFLRDDLARIARATLSEDGYLRAHVETAVVEESATAVTLRVTVARGPKSSRRELVFAGNTSVASPELQRFITARNLEQAAWTDPTGCVRALEDFYALRGFLRAQVRIGEPAFEGDLAKLPVQVTEGPAARVERVTVTGVSASREAAARQALAVTADTPYVVQLERAGQHRLEEYYRDLGFRDARVAVRPTVSEDGARVALDVQVSEGALHRVRDVKVTGIESANASMVQKAIAVQPGSPASQSDATRTKQRLYDTGVFRSADVRFEPAMTDRDDRDAAAPSEYAVDAIVALEESRRYLLRYGVEFAREYDPTFESYTNGVGLSADIRDRNFLGRGIALGLGGRYDPSLHSVRGIISFPRIWQMPFRTNATIAVRNETTSKPGFKIVDDKHDLTVDQRWRAASHLELTWGYAFTDREFTIDTPERALPEIALGGVLAGLIGSAVIDYRDSPFDATRGWFHSSSIQLAMRALGSDFAYTRYLLRQYHYQPVGPLTLAAAARWGTIATGKGVPPITVLDILFKAGGTTTVRGYAEESLSATEFLGVPIGGTELLVLNGEVRFPLAGWFKGVVFADAGNSFIGQSDFEWRDLAVGLGFGLRVKTPLAPIRIDLGFPVPQRSGMKSPRLHFSIGQMF